MPRNSINKVILVGNLGADPETRFTPSGTQVTTVSLATDDQWTDKEGTSQSRTEWHKLVFWRRLAGIASQYLTKGSRVHIEGRLQTSNWEDTSGTRRYVTEVVVSDVKMLDAAGGPADLDMMYAREEGKRLQHGRGPISMPQGTMHQDSGRTSALEADDEDGLPF